MSVSLDSVDSTSLDLIQIHEDQETNSFLRRLASLVAAVYVTFSNISQKERREVAITEREIKLYTNLSADAMKSQGATTLEAAVTAAVIFAASFGLTANNDRLFAQKVGDLAPSIGTLFAMRQQGSSKNYDAIAMIKQTTLQDKSAKAQSEGNTKEAFAQALQAEIGRWRDLSPSKGA